MGFLASFLTMPMMFWLGLFAIASPIIIHLLNRRRFKIVEWAAMEFLLNANKKNRRRVQLENLILLILRCIAIFLVGLLLARPFFPNDLNLFGENREFERLVVLDDSFSMNVRVGNKTTFEIAQEKLKEFVRSLAQDKAANRLTLMLASDVDHPVISQLEVTPETLNEINDAIDELRCADVPAKYGESLRSIVERTSGRKDGLNRIFYLITDLREQDWWSESQSEEGSPAQNLVKDISTNTKLGCYIVDVGTPEEMNLAITELRPETSLKAGVNNTFFVTVTNYGSSVVKDARIDFYSSENAVAQSEIIETLEPGESKSVTRSFPVKYDLDNPEEFEDVEQIANATGYWKVWAEVVATDVNNDLMTVDSKRYYPAEVKRGISVLLVDGDPSAIEDRSETYYLRRALRPVESNSGILPTVVGINELSSVDFSKYQVVYLCNVDQLSEGQIDSLESWTAAGGSLVFMLGDQVNETIFNKQFYFDEDKAAKVAESKSASEVRRMLGGSGLSALKLDSMDGDVNQETWVNLDLGEETSPITRIFEGQGNIIVSMVNFYSWWTSEESGLVPVMDPLTAVIQEGRHYKFGSKHAASKEFRPDAVGNPPIGIRTMTLNSKLVEVNSELVISDVLGQFEKYPLKLITDSSAKFRFENVLVDELLLKKVPAPDSPEDHAYGCYRFKYLSGNIWQVDLISAGEVEDRGDNTRILARYNDEASRPAIAEKRYGAGRTVTLTFPADEDWTNLPQIGSANLLLHNMMCNYLGDSESLDRSLVGDGIQTPVDISRMKTNATITPPAGEKRNVSAVADESDGNTEPGKYWMIDFPKMDQAGFYVLNLTEQEKENGEDVIESRVFAANVETVESDLTRLDFEKVGPDYFGENVKVITGPKMSSQTVQGARQEYWMYILFFLGAILIIEQFLGWWFGRRR